MTKANIYFFNPTCELAVANGSFSYMPPLLLQEMERDLSILPFAFCAKNDIVLTECPPSVEFVKKMEDFGIEMPRFCALSELETLPESSIDTILPWGWSPAAHFKMKNLKSKCSEYFKESAVFDWKEEHKLLFERSTSLLFLSAMLCDNPPVWFLGKETLGKKVTSCEEIESLLFKHSALVLKAPMSSSGRGIQIIRKSELNTSNRQWISGVLKQQNYLIAEPFLEKLMDLSFQFRILSNTKIEYLGYSIFETNSNGQYNGTFIRPELSVFFQDADAFWIKEKIAETAFILSKALETSVYSRFHSGFLGIDALIYRDMDHLRIQPCIEINSRMNMGIFTKSLENRIHPDSTGKFGLFYGSAGEYQKFASYQSQLNCPEIKDGKLYSGFLPLIEPDLHKKFGAYMTLGIDR